MSRQYAEKRIREALKLTKGNPTKARQQVIAWAQEDNKLLLALSQPHLTGIVAHAINRVIHRLEMEEEEHDIPASPQGVNMAPETFGQEILKSLQSRNTARFGAESEAPPVSRKQASQSHIDALKQIAKTTQKKRDK